MPTNTAPSAQAGMPKKKRANGYSATKTRNTPNSSGRMPACRDVEDARRRGRG